MQTRIRLTVAPSLLRIAILAAVVALPMAELAAARSWQSFRDQRVVSPGGRHYVVVRSKGVRSMCFELCERRADAAPLKPAVEPWGFRKQKGKLSPIIRDPRDRLLATGTIDHLPCAVHVFDDGGFLLYETYYGIGRGKTITYVDRHGKVVTQKTVHQIYGGTPSGSSRTVHDLCWELGHWVDTERMSVVVVSLGDEVREVSLKDGKVTTPDAATFARWCRAGAAAARAFALEIVSRKPRVAEDAIPEAENILANATNSIALRMRAAILLVRVGREERPERHASLFLNAVRRGNKDAIRAFAAEHLPEVMGIQALPHLRELMRGPADSTWHPCQLAFQKLGGHAIRTLIEMLREVGAASDYRGGAAHALGEIGLARAVPALIEAAGLAEEYTANAAINAAIDIGSPDLDDRLIALLMKGSTQDGRVALYFQEKPNHRAIPALQQAHARLDPDCLDAKWMREAIEACLKK